jgi:hypothetical protein
VQYLRIFNFIAITVLIVVTCFQVYALGYYVIEEDTQNQNEALFGIAMFAMLSLWVVIPSLFTALKLLNIYHFQSKVLLSLCSLQGFVIIWALVK